jgi:hypothetical protein
LIDKPIADAGMKTLTTMAAFFVAKEIASSAL